MAPPSTKYSAAISPADPEQELLFPMWVVPIKTMIELASAGCDGEPLPTHDELQQQGRLVRWEPGMRTMFLSHTWLGLKHPDPNGDKCRLIKKLLEGILQGRTRVTGYWMATIVFQEKGISAKQLKKTFADGYVWMDYLSIPQLDHTNQGKAIQSIADYIGLSDLFIVLAGAWKHADDGSIRDLQAWGERGWCRMENLANSLSPKQKTFIVARGPYNIYAYGPMGVVGRFWHSEVVGHGTFTVEADKAALGPAILKLIEARKAQADRENDLFLYRCLCAITNRLLSGTGLTVPDLPLDEWLEQMRFSCVHDEEDGSGHSPLRFAIVADRADLVREFLAQGALIEIRSKTPKVAGRPKSWFNNALIFPGDTMLATAAGWCGGGAEEHDATVLKLLLAHGAKPRVVGDAPPYLTALNIACTNSNVPCIAPLMAADPTLWQIPHAFGVLPFDMAFMSGKPHVVEHVLAKYSEQLQGVPAGASRFLDKKGLAACFSREEMERSRKHVLLFRAVQHVGDTRVVKMALDAGCDPNGDWSKRWTEEWNTVNKLPFRILVAVAKFVSDRQRAPMGILDKFANGIFGSALHLAALSGNLGAVELLLEHGAKPESQVHMRRMTPMHCAALAGHESCVDALLRRQPVGLNLAAFKDAKGRTPATLAKKRGYVELAARLKQLEKGGGTSSRAVNE